MLLCVQVISFQTRPIKQGIMSWVLVAVGLEETMLFWSVRGFISSLLAQRGSRNVMSDNWGRFMVKQKLDAATLTLDCYTTDSMLASGILRLNICSVRQRGHASSISIYVCDMTHIAALCLVHDASDFWCGQRLLFDSGSLAWGERLQFGLMQMDFLKSILTCL